VTRKGAWLPVAFLVPAFLAAAGPQATIEDTGSTNRPGLRVTFAESGEAKVEPRTGTGQAHAVKLQRELCAQFLRDLKAVGPLGEMPPRNCPKSVSFGSRLFVEYNGHRSPDLSCQSPQDSTAIQSLRKDAEEILQSAREAAGIPARRVFTAPAPKTPRS
jgi:hypothetical protein